MSKAVRFRDGIHRCQGKFARYTFLPILVAAVLPVLAAAQEKTLRSPWDGKPVTMTTVPMRVQPLRISRPTW